MQVHEPHCPQNEDEDEEEEEEDFEDDFDEDSKLSFCSSSEDQLPVRDVAEDSWQPQIMSSPIDQAKIEEILKLDQANVRRGVLSSLLDRAKDHQRHHSGTI